MDILEPGVLGILDKRTLRFVAEADYPDSLSASADDDSVEAIVENMKCIGSYCWVNVHSPTIIVPGSPRIWKNLALPFQAPRDVDVLENSLLVLNENGYRLQSHSLLPILMAVDTMQLVQKISDKPLDWRKVDYVMDRDAFRKLLHWLDKDQRELSDFRIDTQLVGEHTVLCTRWEPHDIIRLPSSGTYGAGFLEVASNPAPECDDTTAYFRIMNYALNGMQLVVRHGAEACFPLPKASASDSDPLADVLAELSIAIPPALPKATSNIRVVHAGSYVEGSQIIEINTRSKKRAARVRPAEVLPQLLLSDSGTHYLAIHQNGRFTDLHATQAGDPALSETEQEVKEMFKKLHRVLEEIQAFVCGEARGSKISIVCTGGVLRAFARRDEGGLLPADVIDRFNH